jgi:hypothetical protein
MSTHNIIFFKRNWFSALISSVTLTAFIFGTIVAFEPSSAGAATATDTVLVTLNVTSGITINSPADTTMSTALTVTQFSAVGTTTWNVKTNNTLGYTLDVKATSSPAMNSTTTVNSIFDYQQGTPNTWAATTANAYFGYSAFGNDTPTGTWGTGAVCSGANGNSTSTTLKYKGFTTTTGQIIATRSATTSTLGTDTTVCYAVDANAFYIPSGNYQATIIATAITL